MGFFGGGGGLGGSRGREDEAQWMPVSDLMAGVMLVFLFIAVAFMRAVGPEATELDAAERLPRCQESLERCDAERKELAERRLPWCQQNLERCDAKLEKSEELAERRLPRCLQDLKRCSAEQERLAGQRLPTCPQNLERCDAELRKLADLRGISADIAKVLRQWQDREKAIYEALMEEFEKDLPGWNAEIEERTMLVRFRSPKVLFAKGSSELTQRFQGILDDFFPRYVTVLERFEPFLEEIRIEGHTSSEWGPDTPPEEAYIHNMDLSQKRTRSVLGHGLSLLDDEGRLWVRPLLTANGLSSSQTVVAASGAEDPGLSRRVEFRVHTRLRDELEAVDALLNAPQAETAPRGRGRLPFRPDAPQTGTTPADATGGGPSLPRPSAPPAGAAPERRAP